MVHSSAERHSVEPSRASSGTLNNTGWLGANGCGVNLLETAQIHATVHNQSCSAPHKPVLILSTLSCISTFCRKRGPANTPTIRPLRKIRLWWLSGQMPRTFLRLAARPCLGTYAGGSSDRPQRLAGRRTAKRSPANCTSAEFLAWWCTRCFESRIPPSGSGGAGDSGSYPGVVGGMTIVTIIVRWFHLHLR